MTEERAKVIDKGFYKIAKERCLFNDETLQNAFYEGFLDCAEYLLLQLTEKDKQIEKMKCCYNCKHSRTEYKHCRTNKHEKWELAE